MRHHGTRFELMGMQPQSHYGKISAMDRRS
jgi:hypothetical protein